MLVTITTTYQPATDMGYLLHKNPENLHQTSLAFGDAYVFYPEATTERCTAAVLLDIDPVGLVRKSGSGEHFTLQQYVNDRPYVASSFMSVAINKLFSTLFSGKCKLRQELVEQAIPLEIKICVLPCRGGEKVLRSLFEPLGYQVEAERHLLDEKFPEWGESLYFTVTIKKICSLREFLIHIYVLIPVLDNEKHYWIGDDEVEKLLKFGRGWLAEHPEKDLITRRYLKNFKSLTNQAMQRLIDGHEKEEINEAGEVLAPREEQIEKKINLNQERILWVIESLKTHGIKSIVDLGCGEGKLLKHLLQDNLFEKIMGADVSARSLEIAKERLHIDKLPAMQQKRIQLIQTALNYRDKRLAGFDAATLIEVIEHMEPSRLDAFKRVVFEFAKPRLVIITTPNVEYNPLFENLPKGKFRHTDHRFEWTRNEFQDWCNNIAENFGYSLYFDGIGNKHETLGSPTQAGVFVKHDG